MSKLALLTHVRHATCLPTSVAAQRMLVTCAAALFVLTGALYLTLGMSCVSCGLAYEPRPASVSRPATARALPFAGPPLRDDGATCSFLRGVDDAVVFLHVYPAHGWRAVLDDMVAALQLSPLRACGVRTLHSLPRAAWPYEGVDASFTPYEPSPRGAGLPLSELHTLAALHEYCVSHPASLVAYMHGKGTRHSPSADVGRWLRQWDWRRLHTYFLVESPQGCVRALAGGAFDTCGALKKHKPSTHYSGNFWWARCEYVQRLPHPFDYDTRNFFAPEMWIGAAAASGGARAFNCFSHAASHYVSEFSRALYVSDAPCDVDVSVI